MELVEAKNETLETPEQQVLHLADVTSSDDISDANMRLYYLSKQGDSSAMRALVEALHWPAVKIAAQYMGNLHDAEDVVQQAWSNLLRRDANLNYLQCFHSYFFRVVANQCRDTKRRMSKRSDEVIASDVSESLRFLLEGAAPDTAHQHDVNEEIGYVLRLLDSKFKNVLIGVHMYGMSTAEIAEIAGRSEPTIRWRKTEAEKQFREQYNRYLSRSSSPGTVISGNLQSVRLASGQTRAEPLEHQGHEDDALARRLSHRGSAL